MNYSVSTFCEMSLSFVIFEVWKTKVQKSDTLIPKLNYTGERLVKAV